jgi:ribosomal-protein-alanine N-acetyltransferase
VNANFKINGAIIETDRLILRGFTQKDLTDFYEYASVDGVGEMAGWAHHKSIEESKVILNRFIDDDKTFAICHKGNNKVIGSLGIEKYGLEDALTEFNGYLGREIGYVLSKEYWGKGMMPEAMNAVINYLFNELNYDFLLCGYYIFNTQSKRVQEKCGFKPYRKLIMDTRLGTKEEGVLNLLLNPNKNVVLNFSHPETLIYNNK